MGNVVATDAVQVTTVHRMVTLVVPVALQESIRLDRQTVDALTAIQVITVLTTQRVPQGTALVRQESILATELGHVPTVHQENTIRTLLVRHVLTLVLPESILGMEQVGVQHVLLESTRHPPVNLLVVVVALVGMALVVPVHLLAVVLAPQGIIALPVVAAPSRSSVVPMQYFAQVVEALQSKLQQVITRLDMVT